jgi:hypothetical protein
MFEFGKNHIYKSYDNKQPLTTQKVFLVVHWGFIHTMSGHDKQAERLQKIYITTKIIFSIAEYPQKYNFGKYPYTNLAEHLEKGIEIRINY